MVKPIKISDFLDLLDPDGDTASYKRIIVDPDGIPRPTSYYTTYICLDTYNRELYISADLPACQVAAGEDRTSDIKEYIQYIKCVLAQDEEALEKAKIKNNDFVIAFIEKRIAANKNAFETIKENYRSYAVHNHCISWQEFLEIVDVVNILSEVEICNLINKDDRHNRVRKHGILVQGHRVEIDCEET